MKALMKTIPVMVICLILALSLIACDGGSGGSSDGADSTGIQIETGLYQGADISFVVQSAASSSGLSVASAKSNGEVVTATSTTYKDNRRGFTNKKETVESAGVFPAEKSSFVVSDLELSYSGSASGSDCSFNYESTVEFGVGMGIVDGTFTYSSSSYTVSGKFQDSGSVSINLSWSLYDSYCRATYSGSKTYNASYLGAYGTVEGTITDASTGNPLPGVSIIIGGESDTTDANGTYSISKLKAGINFITATKSGYDIYSNTVTVASNAMSTVDIQMTSSTGGGGGNSAPVPNAGPDQSVQTGSLVTLDGSGSSDADGELLIFSWGFLSKPSGSTAMLSYPFQFNPTFIADVDGVYLVCLTVSDGSNHPGYVEDCVTITASSGGGGGNSAPVPNAGPDQNVATGSLVTLNGSGSSDANGDTLTYSWSFTSVPAGSAAALSSALVVNPTFTADVDGSYVLSLVVNDGTVDGVADSVTITASTPSSYYVDTTLGSDTSGDGSSGNPWATIQNAINNTYTGNAIIYVSVGTYNEQIVIQSSYLSGIQLIGEDPATTIIDASGVSSNGGAVKISAVDSVSISGFTIQGGTYEGSGSVGGGIRGESSSVTIENNYIMYNYSYGYENCGGGITVGSNSIVRNNVIAYNSARYCAGGVYVGSDSIIEGNTIAYNSSRENDTNCSSGFFANTRGGGGISAYSSSIIIRNNVIMGNEAGSGSSGYGGGINGVATIYNNYIADNSVNSYNAGYGGAIFALGGSVIYNNTISGNIGDASGAASGIYACDDSSTVIKNNIIVNGTNGVGLYVPSGPTLQADYNDIWNNDQGSYGGSVSVGPNDIHSDPLFVDPANYDFHVQSGSPAIDAGSNTFYPSADVDGDTRPINGTVDIGADEYGG